MFIIKPVMERRPAILLTFFIFLSKNVFSQDFSFNILPLAINPAFTGMFDGKLRATALYKNNHPLPKTTLISYGGSADTRFTSNQPQYFAMGAAFLKTGTTDGSFENSSGIVSFAYHKVFKGSKEAHRGEIGIGVQGGYIQRNVSLAKFVNGVPPYVYHIGGGANYLIANAGISYAQSLGPHLNFAIGLSGNNLTLFNDGTTNEKLPILQVTPSSIGLAIVDLVINDRFGIRPAALYIINKDFYVAGNEFRYKTHKATRPQTVYVDLWYRSGDVLTVTPGYEISYFRLGIGIDYRLSPSEASGNSGFQIIARYIMPRNKQAVMAKSDKPHTNTDKQSPK